MSDGPAQRILEAVGAGGVPLNKLIEDFTTPPMTLAECSSTLKALLNSGELILDAERYLHLKEPS